MRNVNKVTKIDAYPTPSIDSVSSVLNRLRGARYISKIDLKSAFSVIFGMVNVPATLIRVMDALYGPEFESHVFKCLDDIVVVSQTYEEHVIWLEKALRRLVGAGLEINPEKCEFGSSGVTFSSYRLD